MNSFTKYLGIYSSISYIICYMTTYGELPKDILLNNNFLIYFIMVLLTYKILMDNRSPILYFLYMKSSDALYNYQKLLVEKYGLNKSQYDEKWIYAYLSQYCLTQVNEIDDSLRNCSYPKFCDLTTSIIIFILFQYFHNILNWQLKIMGFLIIILWILAYLDIKHSYNNTISILKGAYYGKI
ncbi:hypothetical protein M2325_000646 [Methanococcus voltae PS]|uniref:Uncharacterized protein n=1 Tax=Methanococcus voltae PS TaxID=523842 RepID=A0ABT2EVH9_METVO|nr:hypothetical protein [Methanococcus voltae]MCS3921961.1 hypothetical protein [Methanococcus voltae PS]